MIESLAWIGSVLLALCGFPMMIKSIRDGHSDGVDATFLWMWIIGEILVWVYVVSRQDWPMIFNYSLNIIFVIVILKYKYFNVKGNK